MKYDASSVVALTELLRKSPQTEEIDLAHSGLCNIAEELQILAQFPNLRFIDLGGNELRTLPHSFQSLDKLVALNLSHNKFQSVRSILPILGSLPNLKSLSLTINQPNEEQLVLTALPKLKVLNGTLLSHRGNYCLTNKYGIDFAASVKQATSDKPDSSSPFVLPSDHKKVRNAHYRQVLLDHSYKLHSYVSESFLQNACNLFERLESSCSDDDLDTRDELILGFERSVRLALLHLERQVEHSENDDLFLSSINSFSAKIEIYEACLAQASRRVASLDAGVGLVLRDIVSSFKEIFKDQNTLIKSQYDTYKTQTYDLESKIRRSQSTAENLTNSIEESERDASEKLAHLHSEVQDHITKYDALVGENERLKLQIEVLKNKTVTPVEKLPLTPKEPKNEPKKEESNGHHPLVPRTMSLKNLLEFIDNLYREKKLHDKKCVESKLPFESLEHFMYTYLQRQFGLKTLVVDYVKLILTASKEYEAEDQNIEVRVFRHLLRSELDEGFLTVKKRLEETIVDLLKSHLRGKYPLKSDAVIKAMVSQRIKSCLYEDECHAILKYLYSPQDRITIQSRLVGFMTLESLPYYDQMSQKIRFGDFCTQVLGYQLEGRLALLKHFYECFSAKDSDNSGVLSRSALSSVLQLWRPGKYSYHAEEKIFRALDPFHHNSITFSQAVEYFFNEILAKASQNLEEDKRKMYQA